MFVVVDVASVDIRLVFGGISNIQFKSHEFEPAMPTTLNGWEGNRESVCDLRIASLCIRDSTHMAIVVAS